MRAKEQHISRREFEYVLKRGCRHQSTTLTIVSAPKPLIQGVCAMPSYGVVVSKKVAKKAVVRNRIRRQVYAALATSGVTGQYVVVFTKPALLHLSYQALQDEVCTAVQHIVTRTPHASSR
jgi:ribonuclease P protein component